MVIIYLTVSYIVLKHPNALVDISWRFLDFLSCLPFVK